MYMSTPTPTPPPRPQRQPALSGSPADSDVAPKWQAIAALISAVVGALTFAVGFFGLPAAGVTSPLGVSETVTATTTATTTVTAAVASTPDGSGGGNPSPDAKTPEVQWSGPLLLESYFDLDQIPPENNMDQDVVLNGIDAQEAHLIYNGYALVPKGGSPGFDDCKLLVSTKSRSAVDVPEGRSICLKTNEGRIALVTLDSLHSGTGTVDITVKVWRKGNL
jgi:hypothetical protein